VGLSRPLSRPRSAKSYNPDNLPFPIHRLRRLRRTDALRSLMRETRLDPAQVIPPLFVCPGEGVRREKGRHGDGRE
jgi:Delta-aminolevulinic acid dehydratase